MKIFADFFSISSVYASHWIEWQSYETRFVSYDVNQCDNLLSSKYLWKSKTNFDTNWTDDGTDSCLQNEKLSYFESFRWLFIFYHNQSP